MDSGPKARTGYVIAVRARVCVCNRMGEDILLRMSLCGTEKEREGAFPGDHGGLGATPSDPIRVHFQKRKYEKRTSAQERKAHTETPLPCCARWKKRD